MKGARAAAAIVVVAALAALAVSLFRPRALRVEVGAFDHPFARGGWGRADRVDVDEAAAGGGPTSFYFRPAAGTVTLALPFLVRPGPLRVLVRSTARIRTTVDVFVAGARLGQVL